MDKKRALVTGAAKRIGRSLALELGSRGFDVAVHYANSKADADRLVQELQALGVSAASIQADLLDETQSSDLIARSCEALGGPLSVLVNNASIFENDDLQTATLESWDRHFGSNLRAPFVLTQKFAAQFEGESGAGLIVNMIDQRVRKLTPQFMSYTLAKSALWTLTQTSAQTLAPRIRVNGIGPGPTLRNSRQSAEDFEAQKSATLLGQGANVAQIRGALGYLLEAEAVTGQLLCVDGGQHLVWQTPDVAVEE